MALPIRSIQHDAEDESLAILKLALKSVAIFREQGRNDYGIDAEIELKINGKATGRILKAQVKSSKAIKIRADGAPKVSGIKQSTLHYWIQMSRHAHVVAYAVDLTSNEVFLSAPIFWQATALIDDGNASKTIRLLKPIRIGGKPNPVDVLTALTFSEPSISDVIAAHKAALRQLPEFLRQNGDVHQYDAPMEIHEPTLFQAFLEVCATLIGFRGARDLELSATEGRAPFSVSAWADDWGEVSNYAARRPYALFMPLLIEVLKTLRTRVANGLYYWCSTDRPYAQFVCDTQLPPAADRVTLTDWGDHHERFAPSMIVDVRLYATGQVSLPSNWGPTAKGARKAKVGGRKTASGHIALDKGTSTTRKGEAR